MSLEKYWKKRDFDQTPEPQGSEGHSGPRLGYVIHKHDASRLHYDFRLELEGTLKSWAVPKGPSLDPAEKRLAVQVEDHPLDYGTFEGTIPPKQYGAGTVMLWDYGWWTPQGDPAAGWRKGRLKFRLDGKKLHGHWTLVRMKGRAEERQENWLLIKEHDDDARPGSSDEITRELTASVVSGRSMDEIAAGAASKSAQPAADTGTEDKAAHARSAGKANSTTLSALPDFIEPQLATLVEQAPAGADWLAEIKYDGYRILCRLEHGAARLFTRQRHDWSGKVAPLCAAIAALPARSAWLDGELLALGDDGQPSFQALQQAFEKPAATRWIYYAFDLLHLDGEDLRALPLLQRKQRLQRLLEQQTASDGSVQLLYSDHVEGDTRAVFQHACLHQLEGIIAKRSTAPWSGGRSRSWQKVKCERRQEFVIGGYTEPAGTRQGFGALLLGYFDHDGRLHYAGRVGTGFNDHLLATLSQWLQQHEQDSPAFINAPTGAARRGVHWVPPVKVAEVRFAEWTGEGLLRQAAFLGLREDKAAAEVVREEEETAMQLDTKPTPSAARSRPTRKQSGVSVAGVTLTHPDRVLFADTGLSKLALARYYESVADWILPHLAQRPLTLLRCPSGSAECFFQKHAGEAMPEVVEGIDVPDNDGGQDRYMMVNTLAGLVGLVQMGVLELHTWGSRQGHLDEPDRLILDLDPDPALPWKQVVEGAQLARTLLSETGLTSFVKTTGGKGLHLVVPLQGGHRWDEVKAFSHALANHLAATLPTLFLSKAAKASRERRIYVDWLRNARGATAVAAFSTRARPGAPLSVPIAWEELEQEDLRSTSFTVANIAQRLRDRKQDPWAEYETTRQRLTGGMKALFGLD